MIPVREFPSRSKEMESTTLATKLAVFVVLTIVTVDTIRRILRNRSERKGHPLPPGPTQLPFLGSILSVNTQSIWLTFTEWKAKYGEHGEKGTFIA